MAALICPNHGPQPAGGAFCPSCMEFLVPESATPEAGAGQVCPVPGCGNQLDADGRCPLHDLGGMATEAGTWAGGPPPARPADRPDRTDRPAGPGPGGAPATTRDAPPDTTAYRLEFPFGPVGVGRAEVRVGRADDLGDIAARLAPHHNVSRQHALLWVEHGELYVQDLGSTNGTYVNDRRLDPHTRQRLFDGDELRLASTVRARVRRTGGTP
ncbi:FHA domain-containing protein [Micromonospora haikouensis]|uniref:FHA domain-containing protein n=1 Tax=Micromonospora haikouensis TaxID=686309 RepID=UPI003D75DA8B